ncbi:CDP-glucose 4,6-dehydratase [Thermodesulfobacteriota bacterium]
MFNQIYNKKRIFVTGHTGFKGSWLCLWLEKLGADVTGYSISYPTKPNHFELLELAPQNIFDDIRNYHNLYQSIANVKPDVVFHLAAQSLVRKGYNEPLDTFGSNIMGTANLLEACRHTPSVKAIVIVTSDKCYDNKEQPQGYHENDPMGGPDPYSSSKGCAELVTEAYRKSFFTQSADQDSSGVLVASVRSGNVIGGGDWAEDRIFPDMARAVSANDQLVVRNPDAVRPWQHVLDPLSGYLRLGQLLYEGKEEYAGAWNFGPDKNTDIHVRDLVERVREQWNDVRFRMDTVSSNLYEAKILRLDITKAKSLLNWTPVWDSSRAISETVGWYKTYFQTKNILSSEQLDNYGKDAERFGMHWVERK